VQSTYVNIYVHIQKITENPKSDRRIDEIGESDKGAKGRICARKNQIASEYRCPVDRAACRISPGTCRGKASTAPTDQSAHSTLRISGKKS